MHQHLPLIKITFFIQTLQQKEYAFKTDEEKAAYLDVFAKIVTYADDAQKKKLDAGVDAQTRSNTTTRTTIKASSVLRLDMLPHSDLEGGEMGSDPGPRPALGSIHSYLKKAKTLLTGALL